MQKFLWLILILGALLVLGLITFELPSWKLLGLNIPLLVAGLIAALKFLYWAGKLGQIPMHFLRQRKIYQEKRAFEALHNAFDLFLQNRYQQIPDTLHKALSCPRFAPLAYTLLARCYTNQGNFTATLETLLKARREGISTLMLDILTVEALQGQKQMEQAKSLLQQLLAEHPEDPYLLELDRNFEPSDQSTADHTAPAHQENIV